MLRAALSLSSVLLIAGCKSLESSAVGPPVVMEPMKIVCLPSAEPLRYPVSLGVEHPIGLVVPAQFRFLTTESTVATAPNGATLAVDALQADVDGEIAVHVAPDDLGLLSFAQIEVLYLESDGQWVNLTRDGPTHPKAMIQVLENIVDVSVVQDVSSGGGTFRIEFDWAQSPYGLFPIDGDLAEITPIVLPKSAQAQSRVSVEQLSNEVFVVRVGERPAPMTAGYTLRVTAGAGNDLETYSVPILAWSTTGLPRPTGPLEALRPVSTP
jgi:hypothetical protein